MTTNDIDAIRQLGDVGKCPQCGKQSRSYSHGCGECGFGRPSTTNDIDAIRTHVPALCDEIEQLRAEREHMELNPTGTVEWLKNRVNELTAERDAAADAAKTYLAAMEKARSEAIDQRYRADRLSREAAAVDAVVKAAVTWRQMRRNMQTTPAQESAVLIAAVDALPTEAEVAR